MQTWRNAQIRTKCAVLLLVALVGMSFFAVARVVDKQAIARDAERSRALMQLSVRIGDTLHDVQRERGRSAQLLGGAEVGSELAAQRTATDRRIAAFLDDAAVLPDGLTADVTGTIERAVAAVRAVPDLRRAVDARPADGAPLIGRYTATNASMIDAVAGTARSAGDAELGLRLQAYVSFLTAKELAGRERAALSNALGTGRVTAAQRDQVTRLTGAFDTSIEAFERQADEELRSAWRSATQGGAYTTVRQLEERTLATAAGARVDVTVDAWFAAATARIDAMKQLEDRQARDIGARAVAMRDEARGAVRTAATGALLVLLAVLAVATFVVRSITRPLAEVTDAAERIAVGDVAVSVQYRSRDEVGRLADSFRNLTAYVRDCAEVSDALAHGDLTREVRPRSDADLLGTSMSRMLVGLRSVVGRIRDAGTSLGAAAEELAAANVQLAANVEETATMAVSVSGAAHQMNASFSDVSRHATEAAESVAGTTQRSTRVQEAVGALRDTSAEVGSVAAFIDTIAEQTHLLALNATIEAARAGDAGRGFAVVAQEVKQLSEQTASATAGIRQRIAAIQSSAETVAAEMGWMHTAVDGVSQFTDSVAAAVEEQVTTTAEIGRNIDGVASATRSTAQLTDHTAEAAKGLAVTAAQLQSLVDEFRIETAGR
jgi:methyl-accepting chemotaxis protein